MSRPKKKPQYDSNKIMQELLEAVSESYSETGELKLTAEEFDMSALKIRKLLITAGTYSNDISDEINGLYKRGKTVEEIQRITGLGKSSVNGYLPYTKAVYKSEEVSLNADRIRIYRERQKAVADLFNDECEDNLWKAIIAFQKYPFHTSSGLSYVYEIKKGRNGGYNKEMIVNRRKESKTIVWSSIRMAFNNAKMMKGTVVAKPKALGDIRGISYIYPLLFRFGLIAVPENTAKKMRKLDK